MASTSIAVDNEDDFDWEAAVREIDNACETASNQQNPAHPIARTPAAAAAAIDPCSRGPKPNPNGNARQSTLDRFVDSFTKRKGDINRSSKSCVYKKPNVDCGGYDNPGAEGGESAVRIDLEAAQTWIYPVNVPLRDYQFSIAKVALFSNTLVALPTGLGKTLIAAVVMYNYFRWFPEGKIVFTAPSRPLVMQQIEACHNIVGIPQEWAIDMTGQLSPLKRTSFWKTKRVFFVTPQVLEKDIQSGICFVKQIVCLVIDEAHRAMGNYSYCVAVRELMAVPVHLRILALTATPGSKQQTIQNVIDNLCISTLEYRNETDRDVSLYVHNRTLEVIEVEMGKDATGINNLLLEAIQPFATRLLSYGLLYNRDVGTLSPCELLNLRDKFRQAPPNRLDQAKTGEVEGYFGVLITLCPIRKLLTSHGVRPAYEMLNEKLSSSGSYKRLLGKNETIMKAKLLMQQSLSHGAPSPKLVKLIEVLTEHFKAKDPKNSRVIIFSNFRGSVKDIMDSLSSIGDLVKATEFVGQSSGKSLRGQTQKVQQAVLEKFRTGGYNVIVATSIGEEGLDIMEVDLVICFDANISPIRMIQRMGRTGRKHDGRVVILACEGAELKAYKRKLASNKAVNKHMHNGGIKSFTFHSSPRMVPHICKPQAQFVELTIEQFIPRGKKSKEDSILRTPVSNKLLHEEKDLIAKYFHPTKEDIWEPSLIAFPVIQTFPSRVHELRHSFRTTSMLIDAMQHLQGLTMSKAKKDSSLMEVETTCQSPEVETAAANNNEQVSYNATEISQEKISVSEELEEPFKETSEDELQIPCIPVHKFSSHCFLFGEDFVTVNSLGAVLIASVPCLPYKISSVSKVIPLDGNKESFVETINDVEEAQVVTEQKLFEAHDISASQSQKQSVQKADGGVTFVLETPVSKQKLKNQEDSVAETHANTDINMDLSPRLTHFIEEGIVPESPIVNTVPSNFTPMGEKYVLLAKSHSTSLQIRKEDSPNIMKSCGPSPIEFMSTDKIEVNAQNCHCESSTKKNNEDIRTPLVDSVNNSSSENWQQYSEEALKSSLSAPKYRRLRKHGDTARKLNSEEKDNCFVANTCGPSIRSASNAVDRRKGKRKKAKKYVNSFNGFIEEEAEVSQDAEVSEDEEDGECEDHYDDSFIDDRITNTTEASTASAEAETCGDMMAFYRRSLLTQSPAENLQRCLDTHESFSAETGSSEKLYNYKRLQTPQNGLPLLDQSGGRHSVTNHMGPVKSTLVCENSGKGSSARLESRKRKLSFQPIGEHISELEEQQARVDLLCDDDDFYKDLDLDAVEAQATNLLKNKTGLVGPSHSAQFEEDPNMDFLCSPSFDLGI